MQTTVSEQRQVTAQDSQIKLNYSALKSAAVLLRATNNKVRQQILRVINENKRLMVTDVYVKIRLEQSIASNHLAILRRADIVKTERDGRAIYYSLNEDRIQEVAAFINRMQAEAATKHKAD